MSSCCFKWVVSAKLSSHIIRRNLKIIFGYIVKDNSEDILLGALNYIYRFFEDPISYEIDSKHYTVKKLIIIFSIFSLF